MVFLCGSFMLMVFIFMMLLLVLCFVFQRMMVMAENRLVIILPVQPGNKSFVKIDDIDCQGYYIQRVFHLKLHGKFIENKNTEVGK